MKLFLFCFRYLEFIFLFKFFWGVRAIFKSFLKSLSILLNTKNYKNEKYSDRKALFCSKVRKSIVPLQELEEGLLLVLRKQGQFYKHRHNYKLTQGMHPFLNILKRFLIETLLLDSTSALFKEIQYKYCLFNPIIYWCSFFSGGVTPGNNGATLSSYCNSLGSII